MAPITYFCGKFHHGTGRTGHPGVNSHAPGRTADLGVPPSALFVQDHLHSCGCHLEGTSPPKAGNCPAGNALWDKVTITQCSATTGALFRQLLALVNCY